MKIVYLRTSYLLTTKVRANVHLQDILPMVSNSFLSILLRHATKPDKGWKIGSYKVILLTSEHMQYKGMYVDYSGSIT